MNDNSITQSSFEEMINSCTKYILENCNEPQIRHYMDELTDVMVFNRLNGCYWAFEKKLKKSHIFQIVELSKTK